MYFLTIRYNIENKAKNGAPYLLRIYVQDCSPSVQFVFEILTQVLSPLTYD